MDVAGAIRPLPAAAAQPLPANVGAQPTAVKTVLPAAATVKASDSSDAVRLDARRGPNAALDEAVRRAVERHIAIDPETKSLVFRVVDERSGEVKRQIPDEVILRLRAHVRDYLKKADSDPETRRVERIA
jgi:hypothetical protein